MFVLNYLTQHIFSGWHIATQVLYFIAAVFILTCEIYARLQMCCSQKSRVVLSLAILVLISGKWRKSLNSSLSVVQQAL